MPQYRRPALAFLFLALGTVWPIQKLAAAEQGSILSVARLTPGDEDAYREAFEHVAGGDWEAALAAAARAEASLLAKAVRWLYLTATDSSARFSEISSFLESNPHWPLAQTLRANAELALIESDLPTSTLLDWFRRYPPETGAARVQLALALQRSGRTSEAEKLARLTWTTSSLRHNDERALLSAFEHFINPIDDSARTEWLLWRGLEGEAERMLPRLTAGERQLAEARIALRAQRNGVDARIASVPDELKNDPRLVFERVRWRRRAGRNGDAGNLLLAWPEQIGPEMYWWTERRLLSRDAIIEGNWSRAYSLLRSHGQTDRSRVSDAEWLAGWIALRYLADPESAYLHFSRQREVVRYPVSLARAAYWSARAAEAKGKSDLARSSYEEAGRYFTTFYGQLALASISQNPILQLPPSPVPALAEISALSAKELAIISVLLENVRQKDYLRPFLNTLMSQAVTPGDMQLVTRLAKSLGRLDISVNLSKIVLQRGWTLGEAGWPVLREARQVRQVETALVLAIIRQESEFNERAISPAGALGLMQLMPETARDVARTLNIRYNADLLTEDTSYNIRLGAAYLADLLERFDGSYVLAICAYNAGHSRVKNWIDSFGDPRNREIDTIDWIERVPFDETRNYLHRVLENLQVYRAILADGKAPLAIISDLNR